MKQSTSFAQVATNLLNVLQGCSKSIRLLLVMFLTLTVSANVWADSTPGTGYTLVTDISSLSTNDKVILFCNQNGEGVSGYNGNKDATVSTTAASWIEYLVTKSTNSFTLKDGNKYIANPGGNEFKYGNSGGACTLGSDGLLICNSRNLMKNGTNYRFYATTQSYTNRFYVYKVAVSYAITAQSNNTTYGTVSLSGTTITATPKDGYRVKSGDAGYTVTSGTAVVTNNGNNTFSVTPSSDCTITINFEAIPKYTVTLVPGSGSVTDTELEEPNAGDGVTLPTPTLSSACQSAGWSFAGWATSAVATETTTKPTLIAAGAYSPTSDITLYAVYQRTETTSGGGGGESHSITITPNTFTDKGSNNYGLGAERIGSENAVSFGGHYITGNIKNTPSGATAGTFLQCQANNATIYNKTEFPGKITKIVVNQHEARAFSLYCGKEQLVASNNTNTGVTPSGTKITDTSSATTMTWNVSGDYTFFALKKGSNASYITSIVVTYQTNGGQSETTYYHSTPDCGITQPSRYLTPKHRGDSGGT